MTNIEGKSVLWKIGDNDDKFYLSYLNKLVDKNKNTYHCSIGKKSVDVDYSVLTKEIKLSQ